jgi:hypothetical protein
MSQIRAAPCGIMIVADHWQRTPEQVLNEKQINDDSEAGSSL